MGIALGLLGGLFLGGAVYLSPARLAKTIDRDLRAWLGPLKELHVYVRGPRGVPVMKGRFDSVDIRVRGFNGDRAEIPAMESSPEPAREVGLIKAIRVEARDFVYDGVEVRQAAVSLTNLRFDAAAAARKQVRLIDLEQGSAEVRLTEASLRAGALARLTGVLEPKFEFAGGRIKVSGRHKVSVVPVPFSLSGRVVVREGREVHLDETDLRVSVVPIPDRLEQRLLADLNPVYVFKSATQLPFAVEVQRVHVEGNELVANCSIKLNPPTPSFPGLP